VTGGYWFSLPGSAMLHLRSSFRGRTKFAPSARVAAATTARRSSGAI